MYFVYHASKDKVQEYNSLSALLEMFEKSDSESDLFWTLGMGTWTPLSQILTGSIVAKKELSPPPPPTPAKTPEPVKVVDLKKTRQEILNDENFKIVTYEPPAQAKTPLKPNEHRKHPRFDVRLKVIISNKEKTFLSYTSNASIGGLLLEDNIPHEFFTSDEAEIFVSSPKKNEFLAFRCRPVGDDESPKRFSFGAISDDSLLKFQNWIEQLTQSAN